MDDSARLTAAAFESGYADLGSLIAWADQQIERLSAPPLWIIDVSLARTDQEARAALDAGWNQRHKDASREGPDPPDEVALYLGFLYLRFERGDFSMARLLELAGEYTGARNGRFYCETFYHLWNEIDRGGPTIPNPRPLADRVSEVFAPMATVAARYPQLTTQSSE